MVQLLVAWKMQLRQLILIQPLVVTAAANTQMGSTTEVNNSTGSTIHIVKDEPTNHPSGLSATPNSSSQISTVWTDVDDTDCTDGGVTYTWTGFDLGTLILAVLKLRQVM